MMNDIHIHISTGKEEVGISGGPPAPMPLEQIGAGMAGMERAMTTMPPVPSMTLETIEGLPVPVPLDQLGAMTSGVAQLPVPAQQSLGTPTAAPVPMSLEELEALANASLPKEGTKPKSKARNVNK
jgi:hypothetical protein